LLARTEELSKRWLLALVGAIPLEEIAALKLAPLARLAPSLCSDVLCALRSDAALQPERPVREERGGGGAAQARGPLRLEWVDDLRGAVLAVEALRHVLWEALVYASGAAALGAPSDRLLSDLADRLAYVCSVVLVRSVAPAVALGVAEPQPTVGWHAPAEASPPRPAPPWVGPETLGEPATRSGDAAAQCRGHSGRHEASVPRDPPAAPSDPVAAAGDSVRPPEGIARPRAVLVDEFTEPRGARRGEARVRDGHAQEPADGADAPRGRSTRADGRALPWDIPLAGGRHRQGRERAAEPPRPRPDGPEPTISIMRRRPPRERE